MCYNKRVEAGPTQRWSCIKLTRSAGSAHKEINMYNDGFVVAIKVGDRFVEEKGSGNFVVPFSSEYSVRLKNRNSRKAVARIYIDGEEVNKLGSFILDANSTLDLERFVDKLDAGNKFRFVPLSNSDVKDKNNGENGIIEARFQLVKPVEKPIIYREDHHHHYGYPPLSLEGYTNNFLLEPFLQWGEL